MVSEEQYLRRLDLTRYGGQDIYSDGDVEEDLFHFVRCENL